ncbi:MAG: DMT family transporter [Synergistaceae bacterium]|nr:DMT family transporter [Synergistaceae bacterium]
MLETILVILIGLAGGVAVGLQSPLAGALGQRIGPAAGSAIVHLGGLLLSLMLVLQRGGERIGEWASAPWYMLVSGTLGVVLFLTINVTLPRLGAAAMIALIIVGQLLTGVLIDTQGWLGVPVRPLDLYRAAGILLLLAGGWLLVR